MWSSSPSNDDYEFWNSGYEIPGETHSISSLSETVTQVDETLSTSSVSQAVGLEQGKGTSYVDSSDVISSSTSQNVCPTSADVDVKKKEFTLPVPLGKLIRDCARAPNVRPRDRWRERSVSRARECIVASKRKTMGLPPVFRPPADCRVRSHYTLPQPQHIGMYRSSGSHMPSLQPQFGNDRWSDRASSTNASWQVESIKVRVVLC